MGLLVLKVFFSHRHELPVALDETPPVSPHKRTKTAATRLAGDTRSYRGASNMPPGLRRPRTTLRPT